MEAAVVVNKGVEEVAAAEVAETVAGGVTAAVIIGFTVGDEAAALIAGKFSGDVAEAVAIGLPDGGVAAAGNSTSELLSLVSRSQSLSFLSSVGTGIDLLEDVWLL